MAMQIVGQATGCLAGARTLDGTITAGAHMEITKSGSQPSGKGPADWFTGTVRIDPLFRRPHRRGSAAPASRSSRARAPRGTRIRSDRR